MPPFGYAQTQKNRERKHIKKLSWCFAAATGGFFLIANILYGLYMYLPVNELYASIKSEQRLILQLSIDLIITLISLALPFAVVYRICLTNLRTQPIALGKPRTSAGTTALFVLAGSGCLLIASYVTNYLTVMFESMTGIEFEYSFFDTPTTAFGIVIFYLRSAFMPALTEEFAMRGVVMQPLRRYGDTFALAMSSLVFALMHGNMIQAPFAFLAGFILGYAVIKTGTLWTSVLIHFINNAFSVTVSILYDTVSEELGSIFSLAGSAAMITVGIIALILLSRSGRLTPPVRNNSLLPDKQCYLGFIFTVPMILVLAYMMFQTGMMIKFPDLTGYGS